MGYQNSWKWLHDNWNQPIPTVAYVATVSCVVGTKNTLSTKKHDVLVEVHRGDIVTEESCVHLPRLCIMARASWIEQIKQDKQCHPFLAVSEA